MAMENQNRIFISYSRLNKEFALGLAKELKSCGFGVWLDQLDIPPGKRWDDELEKALEECGIFMVILTPASMASENVKDEIGYAIDSHKRILPVLLENATLPLRLRRFQYVDFTSKSYSEGIEGAKQLLSRLIQESTDAGIDSSVSEIRDPGGDPKAAEDFGPLAAKGAHKAEEATAKPQVEPVRQPEKQAEPKVRVAPDITAALEKKAEPVSHASQKATFKKISKKLIGGIVIAVFASAVICIVARMFLNAGTPAVEVQPTSEPASAARTPTSSGPVILTSYEAEKAFESGNYKGIFALASEQHTEAELNTFIDNKQTIPVLLDVSVPISIGTGWCATSYTILTDNFKSIKISFRIDGKSIPESNYASIRANQTADDGTLMECLKIMIVTDRWTSGKHNIHQEFKLSKRINDGIGDYDPFTDELNYIVTVP